MKNIEAKWLGGVTAETYAAGSVQFTWEDSNGNPKLENTSITKLEKLKRHTI